MTRIFSLILALTLISLPLFGGEIFVVKYKTHADVVVYVTDRQHEADLFIKWTEYDIYAEKSDHYWKRVNYENSSVVKVMFTPNKYDADIIVYFCDSDAYLGWKKKSKFEGMLH